MKIISLYLLAFIISVTSSLTTAKAEEVNEVYGNTQRDVMIVFGTGLFGSVLGLSTLSFVEVPEDHLNNIVVGGAWGIILGVGIVAYSQAEKSKDYYYDNSFNNDGNAKTFNTAMRSDWHNNFHSKLNNNKSLNPLSFNYSVQF
ncbi:MAG: hypothetical protein HOJ35_08470 [Bdellovibrionales bacterium]|nr:hypothetical protein [Bdellovibrionales bacterium]